MTDELKAGWGKSPASRKWHYFPANDTFSLCRKIGFFSSNDREDTEHDHKDNCAECKKKRIALQNKIVIPITLDAPVGEMGEPLESE